MDRSQVQDWLDRYVAAWRANQRQPIEALFTEDATYRFRPYGDNRMARGISEIVDAWLNQPDEPNSWEASYTAFAADGNRAVATGTSRYLPGSAQGDKLYHNVFLMEFAPDGRCSAFTEFWMLEE